MFLYLIFFIIIDCWFCRKNDGLHGPGCLISEKVILNLITHSLVEKCTAYFVLFFFMKFDRQLSSTTAKMVARFYEL